MISKAADFRAVRTARAYEQIVAQIELAIAEGSLAPGQRLPSEREMMENFSVSRPTVREALRVLESMGVVRSRHGDPHGPEILPPSSDLLYRPISSLVRTRNLDLGDFVPVRVTIEGLACELAAELRTDEHLREMDQAITLMDEVIRGQHTTEQFGRAELRYHQALWDASGNGLVALVGQATQGLMLEMISGKLDVGGVDLMRMSRDHDAEILEAIRAREPERAARLARRYIAEYYGEYVPGPARAFVDRVLSDEG